MDHIQSKGKKRPPPTHHPEDSSDFLQTKKTCSVPVKNWEPNSVDLSGEAFLSRDDHGDMSFDPVAASLEFFDERNNWGDIAVWRNTLPTGIETLRGLDSHTEEAFSGVMMRICKSRVKYVGAVRTLSDTVDGEDVPGTGGRSDLIIFVHKEDISKFSDNRSKMGVDKPVWMRDLNWSIYPRSLVDSFSAMLK